MLYRTYSTTMVISVTGKRFERVTCIGIPGLHADVVPLRSRAQWKDNHVSNMTMLWQMSGGGACCINEMRNVGCKGDLGSILGTRGSIGQTADHAVWTNGFCVDGAKDIDLTALWQDSVCHP